MILSILQLEKLFLTARFLVLRIQVAEIFIAQRQFLVCESTFIDSFAFVFGLVLKVSITEFGAVEGQFFAFLLFFIRKIRLAALVLVCQVVAAAIESRELIGRKLGAVESEIFALFF